MRRFLQWLSDRRPARVIHEGMLRYYLFTLCGKRVYLHHMIASDPDRGLHDHPWPWALSLVLSGYYYEHTRTGVKKRRWLNWLTGDTFHRVILPMRTYGEDYGFWVALSEPQFRECWTLFIHSATRKKQWGFLREVYAGDAMGLLWTPYSAQSDHWWETAPNGRQLRERGGVPQ